MPGKSRQHHHGHRGFAMLIVVGMIGILGVAILATSAMFSHQAKRTRIAQQQAQQRQLEIARVLLGDKQGKVELPD